MKNIASISQVDQPGLSPKKTLFIMVIVVGCVAILWPKVFYPMTFGSSVKQNPIKDHRSGTEKSSTSICCDVVLDRESFFNTSSTMGERIYRQQSDLFTDGEIRLRQERPPHLRSETIHPAMRERGRAIPTTTTIPIVEKAKVSSPPLRVVEGRPGPIPGMRPPLGAGSAHQAPTKATSMGFIMPLYTVGIVAFFIYTVMKILFKKPISNSPYTTSKPDPTFHKEVFGHEKSHCKHLNDFGGAKIGCNQHGDVENRNFGQKHTNGDATSYNQSVAINNNRKVSAVTGSTATDVSYLNGNCGSIPSSTSLSINGQKPQKREHEQLMEIDKLRRKLEETERAMAQLLADMNCDRHKAKDTNSDNFQQNNSSNISNGHTMDLKLNHQSSNINNSSNTISSSIDLNSTSNNHFEFEKQKITNYDDNTTSYHETNLDKKNNLEKNNLKQSSENVEKLENKNSDDNFDKTVMVLGMELTASCEGGQKWNRPPTPVFIHHTENSTISPDEKPNPPQPIYLEGALPHESQILVADSETHTESVIDNELNGSINEPAVVLSSKMTLSLINLNSLENSPAADENNKNKSNEMDDSYHLDTNEIEGIVTNDEEQKSKNEIKDDDDDDDNGEK